MPVACLSLASIFAIRPLPSLISRLNSSKSSLYPSRIIPPSRTLTGGSSSIARSINSVISSTSTDIQEEQPIIITPVKIAKKIIILIACIGLFAYWFEPGFPLIAGIVMVGLALGFYKEIVYFFQERMA